MLDKRLIDRRVGAAHFGICLFHMDDRRVIVELLAEGEGDDTLSDENRAALELKILEVVQDLDDRLTLKRDERIVGSFLRMLLVPAVDRQLALRDDLIRNGLILGLGIILAEAVQMVLLRMELAPCQLYQIVGEVDIVKVVAVRLDSEICALVIFKDVRKGALDARKAHGLSLRLEVVDEASDGSRHLLLRAERLHGEFSPLPLSLHIKHIVFLHPHDLVRFVPHVEVRKIEVRILIVTRPKKTVEQRLVLFLQNLEIYDAHSSLAQSPRFCEQEACAFFSHELPLQNLTIQQFSCPVVLSLYQLCQAINNPFYFSRNC